MHGKATSWLALAGLGITLSATSAIFTASTVAWAGAGGAKYGTDNPVYMDPFRISEPAEVITGASPDNSFSVFVDMILQSRRRIKLAAYMMRSPGLAEALADAAKRGVEVTILLDGWTVGRPREQKIDELELYLARQITLAGGKVLYLRSDQGGRKDRRFVYLHAKYAVIDDGLFLSSENFANNGFSPNGTIGSRGWVIAIRNSNLANHYAAMFKQDSTKGPDFDDIYAYGSLPEYTLNNDSYEPDHEPSSGLYRPVPNVRVKDLMKLERVVSPDDTLASGRAILGSIKTAQHTLEIENLSFAPHWGTNEDTPESKPSAVAEAVLDAARRGVKVRLLLNPQFAFQSKPSKSDGSGGGTVSAWKELASDLGLLSLVTLPFEALAPEIPEKVDTKDNSALLRYFRDAAEKESLDLQANFFYVKEDSLRLLHNKGLVADGTRVLVSSINWTENSLKNNRETGVLVEHPKVAGYYRNLFELDWKYFRNPK